MKTDDIAEQLRRDLTYTNSNEPYREALKIIAGIPDKTGTTYGSELHDVGSIARFARKVLGLG